jgi:hypothetical protein
LGEV